MCFYSSLNEEYSTDIAVAVSRGLILQTVSILLNKLRFCKKYTRKHPIEISNKIK